MTTSDRPVVQRLVIAVWAIGVLAHLAGNPAVWWGQAGTSATVIVPLLAGGAAAALLLNLSDDRRLHLTTATTMVLAATRTPALPNHLLLLALVGAALSLGGQRRVAAVARVGAAAYALAALAKANTSFLDPATSCAPLFADRLLGSWGLPSIAPALGDLTPWATLSIEAAIAVGLLAPATRRYAAALGLAFHGLLALDLDQHFWDFTLALSPVFLAAAPNATRAAAERAGRVAARLRPAAAPAVALVGGAALLNLVPAGQAAAQVIGHLLWIAVGLPAVGLLVVGLLGTGAQPDARPAWGVATTGLVAVAVVLGALPHLEVSNGRGWDMYANLSVIDGQSNHLLIPAMPLRDDHGRLAAVIDASDQRMAAHAERGELVPETNLRAWAADHEGRWVTYSMDGAEHRLEHGDAAASRDWEHRWLPLRAVATDGACRVGFGPGG